MVKQKKFIKESDALLGKQIERYRLHIGMTRKQLGKIINEPEQKIAAFERGEFIALSTIEAIGLAMDCQAPKKIIRKISDLRFREKEKFADEQEALCELYAQLFSGTEDYD